MKKGVLLFVFFGLFFSVSYAQMLHESYENNANGWTNFQVVGNTPFVTTGAKKYLGLKSEFVKTTQAVGQLSSITNEAWFISPQLDLSSTTNPSFVYYEIITNRIFAIKHEVLYSTNYSGAGDPSLATWTVLNNAIGSQNSWTQKGTYNLPNSANLYIAYYYKGTSYSVFGIPIPASKWYIDDAFIFDSPCSDLSVWKNSNWDNITPTINTVAVFGDNYNTFTNSSVDMCKCKVLNGNTITVSDGNYFNIENDIINNGDLIINNQGALVQVDNSATVSGSGTFTTKKSTTTLVDKDRFTYFSSPVISETLGNVFTYANQNKMYSFDHTTQLWNNELPSKVMTVGLGYAIQGDPSNTYPLIANVDYAGVFNNGVITQPIAYNAGGVDDDNTLIGNPYPSAINADDLLNTNTNLDTFYFWTHNSAYGSSGYGGDYATYNLSGGTAAITGGTAPTGKIASCQGFFTTATATGSVTFNNTMRLTGNNDDFRNLTHVLDERIWINVSNSEGVFNQILLNFSDHGSNSYDSQYDGVKYYSGNQISFYSIGNSQEKFAIQARPMMIDSQEVIIPLGLEINDETINKLEFSIANKENFDRIKVYLKDKFLNVLYDLNNANYDIENIEVGTFTNRYELVFIKQGALSITDLELHNIKIISLNNNSMMFKADKNIVKIEIFDLLGRKIVEKQSNSNETIIQLRETNNSVLIAKVLLENNQLINQKFVLY